MAPPKRARGRTIIDMMQAQPRTRAQTQAEALQIEAQPEAHAQTQFQTHSQTHSHSQTQSQSHPQTHTQTHSQQQQQPQSSHSTQATGTSINDSTSSRRGRGMAKGFSSWGTEERLHLQFNHLMQPIGKTSKKLSTHLGIIARNGAQVPLTYISWKEMPEDVLDYIWAEIRDNTDAPLEYKENCLESVSKVWKDWKSRIKTDHYNKWETDEERLAYTPDRVEKNQWEALVTYWGTEKAKDISTKYKRNRQLQEAPHRTGRKSFAVVREEMEKEGKETDRINVFVQTRTPKDGHVHPDTASMISELQGRVESVPMEQRTPAFREEVFTQVVGHDTRGRVRTFGIGATPKNIFGEGARSSTTNISMERMINEAVESRVQ